MRFILYFILSLNFPTQTYAFPIEDFSIQQLESCENKEHKQVNKKMMLPYNNLDLGLTPTIQTLEEGQFQIFYHFNKGKNSKTNFPFLKNLNLEESYLDRPKIVFLKTDFLVNTINEKYLSLEYLTKSKVFNQMYHNSILVKKKEISNERALLTVNKVLKLGIIDYPVPVQIDFSIQIPNQKDKNFYIHTILTGNKGITFGKGVTIFSPHRHTKTNKIYFLVTGYQVIELDHGFLNSFLLRPFSSKVEKIIEENTLREIGIYIDFFRSIPFTH